MTVWFFPQERLKLKVVPWDEQPSKTTIKEIDALWKKATQEKPLFDGEVLCVKNFSLGTVEGFFVPYRYFYAQKNARIRKKIRLHPLGVSGLVTFGEDVLVGKRSSSVTQYKQYWECLPSGGVQRGGSFKQQVIRELQEEAGIKKDSLSSVTLLGLLYSARDRTFDVGFHIKLAKKAPLKLSGEYSSASWKKIKGLNTFFNKEKRVVPLSCALLDAYAIARDFSFVSKK